MDSVASTIAAASTTTTTTTTTSATETIFRSKLPDIDIPNHLPLYSYCFQNSSLYPNRPCIIDASTGQTLTYADVDLLSRRAAAGLCREGITKGDVIMLLLHNSVEFVATFLGASLCGAIPTTVNPFCTSDEICKQAMAAGIVLVVTEASYVDKVRPIAQDRKIILVCTDSSPEGCLHFSDLLSSPEQLDIPEHEFQPDDTLALVYSSGTMGLPKGVMMTHKSLVTNLAQQVDGDNPNIYIHPEDVLLCVLPMFHMYSFSLILFCLRVGAATVIMRKFEIKTMLEVVEKYKVTIMPLAPPIMVEIAKGDLVGTYNLSSIRMVLSGAAPLGKELEDVVKAKLPNATLGQGYGMSEAGPAISGNLAFAKEPFNIKSGACGTVLRNAELKVVDEETGLSLPRNQTGEICVRGPQIMKGYFNDPNATKNIIDKDGWLHTGDIGFVDDDDEIFIVDRLKEIIKYKGFQVAPAELEDMLLTHPEIASAAVVPMKDTLAGEIPVAFIVRAEGSNLTEDEIMSYISKQVTYYKKIKRVFFIDSIPKSISGKILRKNLKAKVAAIRQEEELRSKTSVNPQNTSLKSI